MVWCYSNIYVDLWMHMAFMYDSLCNMHAYLLPSLNMKVWKISKVSRILI